MAQGVEAISSKPRTAKEEEEGRGRGGRKGKVKYLNNK
jgi:hypothetical protein